MNSSMHRTRSGFTLIEMLAVITIIFILYGIVIAATYYVKDKKRNATAEIQIQMLANACEEYKMDHGSYPGKDENSKADGKDMSIELYNDLYWDSNRDGSGPKTDTTQKIYVPQLDPLNNKQGWIEGKGQNIHIVDPWGNEYRYRKGLHARNPDFDLWSAGKDGKTNPNNAKDKVNRDDIWNK